MGFTGEPLSSRLDLTLLYVQGFTNEHDLKLRSRDAEFWAETE
jgi:hypothetical protein